MNSVFESGVGTGVQHNLQNIGNQTTSMLCVARVADPPPCIYSNNHITTDMLQGHSSGVSHCSSNVKLSSSPAATELLKLKLFAGPHSLLINLFFVSYLPLLLHFFSPDLLQSVSAPVLSIISGLDPPPASLHLSLSFSVTPCSAESCPQPETVAGVSCTTVSMVTGWQCHLAGSHQSTA